MFKRRVKYSIKNTPEFLRPVDGWFTEPMLPLRKDDLPKKTKRLASYCTYSTPLLRRHHASEVKGRSGPVGESVEEGMNEFLHQALSLEERMASSSEMYRSADRVSCRG